MDRSHASLVDIRTRVLRQAASSCWSHILIGAGQTKHSFPQIFRLDICIKSYMLTVLPHHGHALVCMIRSRHLLWAVAAGRGTGEGLCHFEEQSCTPIKPRDQSTKVALTSFTEVCRNIFLRWFASVGAWGYLPPTWIVGLSKPGGWAIVGECNLAKALPRGPWFSRQQLSSGKWGNVWQGRTLPAFGSCMSKQSRGKPAGRPALPLRLMSLGGSFMLLRAGTASLTTRRRTMPCHSWISWLWTWSAGWLRDIWKSFELSDIFWSLLVSPIWRWHQDSCTWFFLAPGLTKRQSWPWWPKRTLALSAESWQSVWRTLKICR